MREQEQERARENKRNENEALNWNRTCINSMVHYGLSHPPHQSAQLYSLVLTSDFDFKLYPTRVVLACSRPPRPNWTSRSRAPSFRKRRV